jgi:ferritin-like metal-binding protein YciE
MKIETFQDFFEKGLRYAYDCEQKLAKKGLPEMIENCSSAELRQALDQHLQETRAQVSRLERVFSLCGLAAKTEDNDVIDELATAAKHMISDTEDGSLLRDAALIVNGNLVEHYEMAMYGSLEAFARHLGHPEAASLLQQTLNEEKAADAKLTQIGETSINPRATQERRAA